MKMFRNLCAIAVFFSLATLAYGQTAQIQGRVSDRSGAVVPKAAIRIVDQQTNTERRTQANGVGQYVVSGLNPSLYKIFVSASGFSTAVSSPITLNVDQSAVFDFELRAGGSSETVTVEGSGTTINMTDGTVSAVIDRRFVENMPLNGRSFQDLILLSPGVVTQSSQGTDNGGEFSVNGQRADANNFLVDGVSGSNRAGSPVSGSASAGMLGSATVLGTTQSMLPVDALQEFRISTSTYSAEFGRQPGAQVSLQSRSGTNDYHGTLFDYLRNGAFDANNWFNDYSTPAIPKPGEHQNDFGGTFGGPLSVPRLFSGRNRAFFFFSYEGLRLITPEPASIYYVPSAGSFNTATYAKATWKNLRANAPATLQPVLNAFPLPNCTVSQDPQCIDHGDGLLPYIESAKAPATIGSINARIDVQALPWLRIFARYADSSSWSKSPIGAEELISDGRNRIFFLGVDSAFHGSITNQLRLQYSPTQYLTQDVPTSIGGAQPVSLFALQGIPVGGETAVELDDASIGTVASVIHASIGAPQFQINPTDTVSWQWKKHLFKAGVDYRQTTAYLGYKYFSRDPYVIYIYETINGVNLADQVLQNATYLDEDIRVLRQDPTTKNFGAFFQDEWRILPRLSLSLGLRWDLNPPPSASGAPVYTYSGDLNNPSSLGLSPLGTPLYHKTYTDFGPRFGMAIRVHDQPGHEMVLRGGVGLFYDTGQSFTYLFGGGQGLGSGTTQLFGTFEKKPEPFPMPKSLIYSPIPPVTSPSPTAYAFGYIPSHDIVPPSTIQWNVTLEQAIGKRQSFTIGYVGSAGLNLVNFTEYSFGAVNKNVGAFYVYQNGPGSNYNSLQTTYRRQVISGLQVIASYTWAHAIDSSSTDYNLLPIQRGNSDHDVRNVFSTALVYDLPRHYAERWKRQILANWGVDLRVTARSAFPVQVAGATVTDPVTGDRYVSRLNYNGANPYVYKPHIPGGRQFNPAVFSTPVAGQVGNAPRNYLRAFGEADADLAIRRTFSLVDQLRLQFRVEAFNVANHPNFGTLNVACGTSTAATACNNSIMGQAANTLNNALSSGGTVIGTLGGLYQQGAPRSLQLALKLQF